MLVLLVWVMLCFIVAHVGKGREIGHKKALWISLLLSPIVGIIITLVSKDLKAVEYEQQVLQTQQKQAEALQKIQSNNSGMSNQNSVSEELERLSKLKEAGHLTDEEYQKAKNKVIAQFD
jgi:hypothetical protein